jgi:4-amino-4-deoxy-L-arabinose transferase-like glycosyltransferase
LNARKILQAHETLLVGAAVGVATVVVYGFAGWKGWIAWAWLGSILLISAHLFVTSGRLGRPAWPDLVAPALLVAALSPLYLLRLETWPVQVSSDEVAIMSYAKQYAATPHVDLFGLSTYFGDPAGQLVVWGKLGHLFGGITLEHMRLLHALAGLLIVAATYFFLRQLLPLGWSLFGAAILGLNHTFLMMSRMAMRENLPALVETVAMALLLLGLRKENRFATFLGGAIAGLGFYVHFSGRMIFPLWVVFLVLLAVAYRRELGLERILRLGAISVAAFALVATPYLIAYQKAPAALKQHQREALLLTKQGRELQKNWVFAHSEWGGVWRNIKNGLTAFNMGRVDHAWIYQDYGHGIVDPLTGVLLWVGALVVLVRAFRRRGPPWTLLPLTSFLVLWLAYAFIVNEAPDYSRMLIVLPFVAYLVTEAVRAAAVLAERLLAGRWHFRLSPALPLAAALVLGLGIWNGFIGWDYIHKGEVAGDDIGNTGRYVTSHSRNPAEHFYLAADQGQWQYFVWGWPSIWQDRLRMFAANDAQVAGVIAPSMVGQFTAPPPFVLFMRADLWSNHQQAFLQRYPQARLDRVTPDGRLIAVDVS